MFFLVPAYPGCPGQTAVKVLLVLWFLKRKVGVTPSLVIWSVDQERMRSVDGFFAGRSWCF